MQAQAQIEKGTLLGEGKGKFTSYVIKEVTPLGYKFEYNSVGQFVGIFNASFSHTNNVYWKNDFTTMEWESKGFMSTTDGDIILLFSRGKGSATGPGTAKAEGEGVFVTQSPKLSWLNNKKCRIEVTGSRLAGEEYGKFFAL